MTRMSHDQRTARAGLQAAITLPRRSPMPARLDGRMVCLWQRATSGLVISAWTHATSAMLRERPDWLLDAATEDYLARAPRPNGRLRTALRWIAHTALLANTSLWTFISCLASPPGRL